MDDEGRWYKEWGQSVASELRALELYRTNATFDYFPDKVRAPDIFAEAYFKATDKLGSSPAAPLGEIARFTNAARIEFDRVALELRAIDVAVQEGSSRACMGPTTSPENPRIRLQPGTTMVRAIGGDVVIAFRRFANRRLDVMHTIVPGGMEARLDVLDDGIPKPWYVVQAAGSGRLCSID